MSESSLGDIKLLAGGVGANSKAGKTVEDRQSLHLDMVDSSWLG